MTQFISTLSAIPMRKEPSDRSEMVSQILFGESMRILDENEKWYLVRLNHDNYEGWIDRKQVEELPEEIQHIGFSGSLCHAFINRHGLKQMISAGSVLLKRDDANGLDLVKASERETNRLIEFAEMFLETPYLWGGRTFMGIDCSGFTQIVMRLVGLSIPRDAYQQAEIGENISFVEEATTGDLAFFENTEGKIIHVGMIIRNDSSPTPRIIHSSGKVRIDRIDHLGIFNEQTNTYTHALRIIKRLF